MRTAASRHIALLLLACSLPVLLMSTGCVVKHDENGDSKKLDIQTPVGDVRVSSEADLVDFLRPICSWFSLFLWNIPA